MRCTSIDAIDRDLVPAPAIDDEGT